MMDAVDEFLEHHGVKGMKWGVVREKAASAGSRIDRHVAESSSKRKAVELGAAFVATTLVTGGNVPLAALVVGGSAGYLAIRQKHRQAKTEK